MPCAAFMVLVIIPCVTLPHYMSLYYTILADCYNMSSLFFVGERLYIGQLTFATAKVQFIFDLCNR